MGNDSCHRIEGTDLRTAATALRKLPDNDDALVEYLRNTWGT